MVNDEGDLPQCTVGSLSQLDESVLDDHPLDNFVGITYHVPYVESRSP
jgi:hypothetical protein